ncbi:MAG: sugar transferase [Ilumatobacteraceae bacterium]
MTSRGLTNGSQSDRAFQRRRLAQIVAIGDGIAVGVAFAVVATIHHYVGSGAATSLFVPAIASLIGLGAIRSLDLWNAPKVAVRWSELVGLAKAAAIVAAGTLLADRIFTLTLRVSVAVIASALAWVLLVAWRSGYRSWLALERSQGRYTQRTLIVGTGRQALEIARLAEVHPEAGSHVIGIVGDEDDAEAAGRGRLWLGRLDELDVVIAACGVDRIVVCSDEITPVTLARLIRAERDGGPEVVVHAGLSGVAVSRLTLSTFANEAVLHVESAAPSTVALAAKRLFDIVVAGGILLVASPVLAVIAILVKKEDGGPVLFRQQRVGRADAEFGMLKFRTMCVDAEARLAAMQADNQRTGPLFKMARDPRITKIGHVLRRTSIDELPQLINVLKGDMSLIGPRPALRAEVEAFPAGLHARHDVRPGITGLWQVEARDNPAFDAYERLDIHYVENWSLMLDVVVLLATVEHLVMRPFASRKRGEMATGAATADADDAFAAAA